MLELRGVCKTFNPNTPMENKAIVDLNLQIKEGDFVTVIGGNGAGKSTMLNIISGSIEADKGLVLLNDYDVSRIAAGAVTGIGFLGYPVQAARHARLPSVIRSRWSRLSLRSDPG